MTPTRPNAYSIGAMPNATRCSWCGLGITKGGAVVFEGRMVFHLERCAPAEARAAIAQAKGESHV